MKDGELQSLVASQEWKLWLFGGMIAAAGLGFLFTGEIGRLLGVTDFEVRLGTLLLAFGTLVSALFAIRCPHCGLGLLMHAMSHRGVGQWLHWLLTVKTCPRCGLPGQQPDRKGH